MIYTQELQLKQKLFKNLKIIAVGLKLHCTNALNSNIV
jgi:hypothetical protein